MRIAVDDADAFQRIDLNRGHLRRNHPLSSLSLLTIKPPIPKAAVGLLPLESKRGRSRPNRGNTLPAYIAMRRTSAYNAEAIGARQETRRSGLLPRSCRLGQFRRFPVTAGHRQGISFNWERPFTCVLATSPSLLPSVRDALAKPTPDRGSFGTGGRYPTSSVHLALTSSRCEPRHSAQSRTTASATTPARV